MARTRLRQALSRRGALKLTLYVDPIAWGDSYKYDSRRRTRSFPIRRGREIELQVFANLDASWFLSSHSRNTVRGKPVRVARQLLPDGGLYYVRGVVVRFSKRDFHHELLLDVGFPILTLVTPRPYLHLDFSKGRVLETIVHLWGSTFWWHESVKDRLRVVVKRVKRLPEIDYLYGKGFPYHVVLVEVLGKVSG